MVLLTWTYDFVNHPLLGIRLTAPCGGTYRLLNADPVEHGGQWDYLPQQNR